MKRGAKYQVERSYGAAGVCFSGAVAMERADSLRWTDFHLQCYVRRRNQKEPQRILPAGKSTGNYYIFRNRIASKTRANLAECAQSVEIKMDLIVALR